MKKFIKFFTLKCFITIIIIAGCLLGCKYNLYPFHSLPHKTIKSYHDIESRQDAVKFLLTKFTVTELLDFKKMARDGLSDKEKTTIKSVFKERLSTKEYETIEAFILNEIH